MDIKTASLPEFTTKARTTTKTTSDNCSTFMVKVEPKDYFENWLIWLSIVPNDVRFLHYSYFDFYKNGLTASSNVSKMCINKPVICIYFKQKCFMLWLLCVIRGCKDTIRKQISCRLEMSLLVKQAKQLATENNRSMW